MFLEFIMFAINYSKTRDIDWNSFTEDCMPYNPHKHDKVQNYYPIYDLFFQMDEQHRNQVCFKTTKSFLNPNTVVCKGKKQKQGIFIKYAPLLDPIHYLIGKYNDRKDQLTVLPSSEKNDGVLSKMANPNNASYVDCFFNFLSSQMLNHHQFPNAIDFFGSFMAVQKEFRLDVSEDYDYLQDSEFFRNKQDVLYRIDEVDDEELIKSNAKNTHGNRPKLHVDSDFAGDIVDLDFVEDGLPLDDAVVMDTVYEVTKLDESGDDSDVDVDRDDDSDDSEVSVSSEESGEEDEDEDKDEDDDNEEEDEEDSEEDSENSEEDEPLYAYVYNFPVQMICMEKCAGTLDELLEDGNFPHDHLASALAQVVFALLTFQKAFSFTHNDLHTNNIVYQKTQQKYIVYQYNCNKYYVPTFGRIFKMIDFGRAIYRFQDKVFCSDSFAPGGDAHSQYNCEPYMNKSKPRLDPNMSFDLCRLGCSLYDFLFDEDDDTSDVSSRHVAYQTVLRWCMDDMGKNILYKKNGDERYPNFKLYKMIARIVHKHTPDNELTMPLLKQFLKRPKNNDKMTQVNIDDLPRYYA
jgi:hypothetical protein